MPCLTYDVWAFFGKIMCRLYVLISHNCLLFHFRYKGFYEYAKAKGIDVGKAVGLEVVVDGIVPTGKLILSVSFASHSVDEGIH